MHVFKRVYLLASVFAAALIPFVTFTTYIETPSSALSSVLISPEIPSEGNTENINYLPYILMSIYILGVLFFSIKFIINLQDLILKIRKNPKVKELGITNVLLPEKTPPHTFFSFIFFNKEKFLKDEIPQDVKIHEEAHARQKHSFDVLFVELLQIIYWINPLIFLLKRSIKLNHEFLADRAVIKQGISTAAYQQTLLSFSSGQLQSDLVNPINYSSIKKRFTVMKTKTSKNRIWARSFLLLPVLAGLLYGFSTKEVVERNKSENSKIILQNNEILELVVDNEGLILMDQKIITLPELQKIQKGKFTMVSINASTEAPQAIIEKLIQVIRSNGISKISICSPGDRDFFNPVPTPGDQEKATPEMIAEYNKLVKYYNSLPPDKRVVKQEDANKIMFILSRMTAEQKKKAEKINFDVPPPLAPVPPLPKAIEGVPPPPPPPAPSADTIEITPDPVPFKWIKNVPAPTPPPPSPIESIKEWIDEGADFFYNGKAITDKEAMEIVQKNNGKNLTVQIQENNSQKTIRLSDKKR